MRSFIKQAVKSAVQFVFHLTRISQMDAAGIEHLILSGGTNVLRTVTGALVEVNGGFTEHANQISRLLMKAALALSGKRHSVIIASSTTGFASCYDKT